MLKLNSEYGHIFVVNKFFLLGKNKLLFSTSKPIKGRTKSQPFLFFYQDPNTSAKSIGRSKFLTESFKSDCIKSFRSLLLRL